MISMQMFTAAVALAVVVMIVWMIRRDRLPISNSLWWLTVAVIIAVFGIFPELLDELAELVGVSYPPSLLFILAILTLLIKVLLEDLEVSTNRRRLLRMGQRMAILEAEIEKLKQQLEPSDRE